MTNYKMLLFLRKEGLRINKMSQMEVLAKAYGYEWNNSWSLWQKK